jgi:hypothetical protein
VRNFIIAAAFLAGGVTAAAAQPAPWQPEGSTPGWTFTPGAVFGGAWDSNVTVQSKGDPVRSEWVGLVNPRGELDYLGRQTRFSIGYSGSLEAYRRFNELNRYEQRGRLELRHQASPRVGLYARGGLMVSPTTDRLELGGGAVPFVDVGSQLLSASTGANWKPGARTNVEVSYRFQDVRFDESTSEAFALLRGGYSHAPMASVMFAASRRLSVGGSWQYQHARVDEGLQTFDIQTGAAELAYLVAQTTTIRAGGGMSHLQATNGNLSTSGPAVHASVEHTRGVARFAARYERAFTPTYTFGGITTNQNVSANARIAFGRNRGYVTGGVTHGRTDPVEAIGLGFRTDSLWFDGAVGYGLTRWLRAEAFYNGSHQTSTARGDIARSRVGVQFVTFKPVRIQ